jgi:hypothetical protein
MPPDDELPRRPELILPDDEENWLRAFHRERFLQIVDEEEPDVKEGLRALLPTFRGTLESVVPDAGQIPDFLGVGAPEGGFDEIEIHHSALVVDWIERVGEAGQEQVRELAEALRAWQERHNLDASWVRDAALRTLAAWALSPQEADRGTWVPYMPVFRGHGFPETITVEVEVSVHYEPTVVRRDGARRAIRERVERMAWERAEPLVDAYLDRVDAEGHGAGGAPPPRPTDLDGQLRRLARYQVVEESFTAIARAERLRDPEGNGRKTVAESVEKAAALVGLQLRDPDPGGRPRSRQT